jgi:hypothetical protein
MNHTVNLAITAGVIVYDDRGVCIQTIRLPFATLFFWLPALVYGWLARLSLQPPRLARRPWGPGPGWWRELAAAARFFAEIYFTGGVYWKLVMG